MQPDSDNEEIRDTELLIQEAMGRPLGAYALFLTNDQEVIRALILEGVAIGQKLSDISHPPTQNNIKYNQEK